jgi:hypothetical protein
MATCILNSKIETFHQKEKKIYTYIFFIVMNPTCPLSMSFYMLKIVGKKFQEKNGRSRKKDMNYE